jgi:hypothetical protein
MAKTPKQSLTKIKHQVTKVTIGIHCSFLDQNYLIDADEKVDAT